MYIQRWTTQREMEPHSSPYPSRSGTLRLPQALLLFLRTVLAGPDPDRVPQSDTHLAHWPDIKNLAYRLIRLLNPFVTRDTSTSSTAVGMVKLAAVCGIGSALWLWSSQRRKGAPLVPTPQSGPAVGKFSVLHRSGAPVLPF